MAALKPVASSASSGLYSIRGRKNIVRSHRFLPTILAAVTDVGTAVVVLLLATLLVVAVSLGFFYLPILAAVGWVMVRRIEDAATPSFLDSKPQKGVIYTASELDAMNNRQNR